MCKQDLLHTTTIAILVWLLPGIVGNQPASAASKSPAQLPSIQAPQQSSPTKAAGQGSSGQPASTPSTSQTPAAPPAPRDVPVMVPVATTQRELSPEIQKNLKLLTGQNSLEARQIGAAGMLQQGTAAIGALRQVLSNQPSPIVIQAVAMAIPEIKDPPVELIDPLVQHLSTEDADIRNAIVAALISYRDHNVPGKLWLVASNAQNSQASRLAAVTVLNQLADRDSIETLIDLLEASDEAVRQSSLTALVQLTGVNFAFEVAKWEQWWLTNRNRRPQEWAAPVIASLTEEKRTALEEVKSLRDQLAKAQRKIYSLYSTQEDRTRHIIECLTHPVSDVRLVGVDLVNMLIPVMDRKSIPADVAGQLRKLITDADPRVRLQSVRVLGDLRNSDDAKLLLDSLNVETDPAISQAIARALGLLRNTAAVPVLLEKLNTGDGALAAAAAGGLGILCQKTDRAATTEQVDQVVAALKTRMESANDRVLRQAILDAMARIADERFREQFMAALKSPDPALRQSAVKAFADLNGPDDAEKILAPQMADAETVVREAVCAALGKIGKPSQLLLLLQHCDEQAEQSLTVRRAAEDAAISIMVRMDRPLPASQLEQLTTTSSQVLALAGVLKKALLQVRQNPDSLLQKAAAADLWAKVVLIQPNDSAAVAMLAKVLMDLGNSESLAGTVQRIAAGRNGELAGMLTALAKEMQAAQGTSRSSEIIQALQKIDTSSWPEPNQEALRVFIQACTKTNGTDSAASPASATPTASAPATMAVSAQP